MHSDAENSGSFAQSLISTIEKSGISASALGPRAHSEPHQLGGPGGLHLLGDPSGQTEGGNLPRLGSNDGPATVIAGCVGVLEDLCTFAGASLTKQHTHLQTNRETYRLLLPLHPFTGLFSRTTWVSHYQSGFKRGKKWWGFRMQWHHLDHMPRTGTSIQRDNHTNTPPLNQVNSALHPSGVA